MRDVWVNLHYEPEIVMGHLGDGSRLGMKVQYSFEPCILGTAGAVKALEDEWEETFLVVYGDNLFQFSLDTFFAFHQAQKGSLSMGLFHQETHIHTGVAGGRVILEGERVTGFTEGGSIGFVNAGIYLIEPEIIPLIPKDTFYDFGKDLFPKCINNGIKISGHIINGYCLGIDTPESYQEAIKIIK